MKKSIFAKILILVLCLSLVLCGCGKDTPANDDDPTKAPTSGQPTDPTKGPNSDPSDPSTPGDDPLSGLLGNMEYSKVTLTVGDMLTNVMYVDAANLKFVDQLKLNIEGTEVNAQLYLNQHELVVALPDFVSDAYGINFDTLATDLPSSAIWGMMGTSYDDFMDQLNERLGGVLDTMENLEVMFSGADKCLESLAAALEKALENVEQTTTTGKVDIYGKNVDAEIVKYSVDSAAMEKIVNTLIGWCEENANDLSGLLGEDILTSKDITDAMNEAKTAVSSFFDNADLEASLAMNFNPASGALMSINGSFAGTIDGIEDGLYLNLILGENPAESDLYSFSILDSRNDGFSVTLGHEVVDTKTTFTLTASNVISGEADAMFVGTVSYDTASNKYSASLTADGATYAVNGTCKVTDETFEFTVDTLNADGEEMALNLKLLAESISASEIPNAPKYTNLLKMSEAELMELLEKFAGESEEDILISDKVVEFN